MSCCTATNNTPFLRLGTLSPVPFTWDWSDWLGIDDKLETVEFTVDAALTVVDESHTAHTASLTLTGTAQWTNHQVSCGITTDAGRTTKKTLIVSIVGEYNENPQTYVVPADASIRC